MSKTLFIQSAAPVVNTGRAFRVKNGWVALRFAPTSFTRWGIFQWNGSGWTDRTPPHSGYSDYTDLAWFSDTDVWVLDNYNGDVVHWNGTAWSVSLHVDPALYTLNTFGATATGDLTVFGDDTLGGVLRWNHWNGAAWAGWTNTTTNTFGTPELYRAFLRPGSTLHHADAPGLGRLVGANLTNVLTVSSAITNFPAMYFSDANNGWSGRKAQYKLTAGVWAAAAGAEIIPVISGQSEHFFMQAVHGSAISNVWMTGPSDSNLGLGLVYYLTAWVWNNVSWSRYNLTTASPNLFVAEDVWVNSPTDVWVCGWGSGDPAGTASENFNLVYHWDGSSWADRRIP